LRASWLSSECVHGCMAAAAVRQLPACWIHLSTACPATYLVSTTALPAATPDLSLIVASSLFSPNRHRQPRRACAVCAAEPTGAAAAVSCT
jgi:hypothetical protein